jgi:lysophospholipase L1-like esterase
MLFMRFIAAYVFLLLLAPASNCQVRVMPYGDSNTAGYPSGGGFRVSLFNSLTTRGYGFEFSGTSTEYPSNLIPDNRHQGHSGSCIKAIPGVRAGHFEWVRDGVLLPPNGPQPHLILLMLGTNDIDFWGGTVDHNANFADLVRMIASKRPTAWIACATLPPLNNPIKNVFVQSFNAELFRVGGTVDQLRAQGYRVGFGADVGRLGTPADLIDTWHPNTAYHNRIGNAWAQIIAGFTPARGLRGRPTGGPTTRDAGSAAKE